MNTTPEKPPLAVVCGDPAGIGPEVISTALRADKAGARDCVLIGPERWARPLATELGIAAARVGDAAFEFEPGAPADAGARLAMDALETAARGCTDGRFRGVVSGPVSKERLQAAGFRWPGQTEFFADAWGGEPSMAFIGKKLRVVLATWHVPLRSVPDHLTASCLERAVRRAEFLGRAFGVANPRIGVCGLNPHAGENGLLGDEEVRILDPLLDRIRPEIPGVSRCLPGDTVFFRQQRGEFDVVVAAYHDQGLAAVKTLEFDAAVNVTLGLPFIRTSPDHGTAFDLAGRGQANAGSFSAALSVARKLTALNG
ncbi:MAG: 4-hydroxythreonine-4-phosphate dehydrogenase PdxA [Opitutales bacterium]